LRAIERQKLGAQTSCLLAPAGNLHPR